MGEGDFQVSEFSSYRVSEFLSFQVFKTKGGREGGRTNERPETDHVILGPTRNIKKIAPNGANRQTSRQLDMATLWLNRPRWADSVKITFNFLLSKRGLIGAFFWFMKGWG